MIEVVLLDVDGVLTDGAVWIDSRGEEIKRILFDDIDAVFSLKRAGIKVGFITGDKTSFCDFLQKRFDPDFLIRGCKDKLGAFQKLEKEAGLQLDRVCFVGDSLKDTELLRYVAHSLVPSDVDSNVRQCAKTVLPCERGRGVVREVARYVFNHNGDTLKEVPCSA